MALGVVKKDDLNKFIDAVRKDRTFVAPVLRKGSVSLAIAGTGDEIMLNYSNFKLPPKNLLFPKNEVICTYDRGGIIEVLPSTEEIVMFGLRPCDSLSFTYLDKVFIDEEFVDPYYHKRRKNSIIITLACSEPLETCYCSSVGGNPAGKEGTDILAFDLQDAFLFEGCTKKGQTFMETYA